MNLSEVTDADLYDQGLVSLFDLTVEGPVMNPFPVCHSLLMVILEEPAQHEWIDNIDSDEGPYRKCLRCGQLNLMKHPYRKEVA
ncbi:hypothetical protein [Brucella intermedia]|uniref:hypothetical protein n=1 Tax=Brucella intermedia TaxID=94625 RepID=UPI00224B3FB7|nr:hypothetical protein [Brucella intermedia]